MQAIAALRTAVFGKKTKPAKPVDKWSETLVVAAVLSRRPSMASSDEPVLSRRPSKAGSELCQPETAMSALQDRAAAQCERFEGAHGQVVEIPWYEVSEQDDTYQCFFCSRVPKQDRLALTRAGSVGTLGAGRKLCTPLPRAHFCLKDAHHQQTPFHQHAVKRFCQSPEFAGWCAADDSTPSFAGGALFAPAFGEGTASTYSGGSARSLPDHGY